MSSLLLKSVEVIESGYDSESRDQLSSPLLTDILFVDDSSNSTHDNDNNAIEGVVELAEETDDDYSDLSVGSKFHIEELEEVEPTTVRLVDDDDSGK